MGIKEIKNVKRVKKSNLKKLNLRKVFTVVIAILLIVLVIFGVTKLFKLIFKNNKIYGNMANLGLVFDDGGTKYYNKYDKGIVKIKGGKEYQITSDAAEAIIKVNDTIYYLTVSNSNEMNLKSVKDNGGEQKVIKTLNGTIAKLYYKDNYIYYVANGSYVGVYRINLDTLNEEEIIAGYIQDFELVKNTVYYTDIANHLYKVDIDKKEAELITEEYKVSKIQVVNKWIYFYDQTENALCKIKVNGKSKKTVASFVNNEMYNVTNKGIYYFNNVENQICKCDLKGKKSKAIVKLTSARTKINIMGKELYYLDLSKDPSQIYQMFRVKTNGKAANSIEY